MIKSRFAAKSGAPDLRGFLFRPDHGPEAEAVPMNRDERNDRGSVMMEYVVLNFLFIVALVLSGYFFVSPDGGTAGQATYGIEPGSGAIVTRTETTRRYGILGDAFLQRYDLMVKLVSMPYP